MNQPAKTHPLSNEFIIIYFVGGVTSYEYKLIKEQFCKDEELMVKKVDCLTTKYDCFHQINFYF
jgi:hypothetical protein